MLNLYERIAFTSFNLILWFYSNVDRLSGLRLIQRKDQFKFIADFKTKKFLMEYNNCYTYYHW